MKTLGSVAAVVAAITEDAAAEAEAIERRLAADLERLTTEAPAPALNVSEHDERLVAARRHARERLALEDSLDAREAFAEREQWMARAVMLGRARLAEAEVPAVRIERLTRLVREALARLPPGPVDVVVSAADAALLGPAWRPLCSSGPPVDVTVVAGPIDGGCIVRTADGRASFDNSIDARTRRFETVWRAALASVFEHPEVDTPAGAHP